MSSVAVAPPSFDQGLYRNIPHEPRWHAIYTYPRHEKMVRLELQSRSIEAFLPAISRESQWKDRRVQIDTPIFPGYVFTRIRPSQRFSVLSAPGVVRLLSFNGKPAPIEDSEIEAVKLCLERGASIESCPSFELGDYVRVRSGVLAGLEGRISRCKNERRLIVPITLINQSVAVDVDVSLLEPLDTGDCANV